MNQGFCIRVVYDVSHQCHQLILRHIIKEFLQVDIHYISISVVEVFQQFQHRLLCTSFWSESVTVFTEIWFYNWC